MKGLTFISIFTLTVLRRPTHLRLYSTLPTLTLKGSRTTRGLVLTGENPVDLPLLPVLASLLTLVSKL